MSRAPISDSESRLDFQALKHRLLTSLSIAAAKNRSRDVLHSIRPRDDGLPDQTANLFWTCIAPRVRGGSWGAGSALESRNFLLISMPYNGDIGGRVRRHRDSLPAPARVLFAQHPAENCVLDCSKCVFVVACGNI
jgi:hypothetical protein